MQKQPVSKEKEKGYYTVLSVSPTLSTSTSLFSFCPCFPQLTTHLSLAFKCQSQLCSLSLCYDENHPCRPQYKLFFNALPWLFSCVMQQPWPSVVCKPSFLDEITQWVMYQTPSRPHKIGFDKNL